MPDDTTEARASAIIHDVQRDCACRIPYPFDEVAQFAVERALEDARQAAIEEAARVADALEDEWHEEWRKGHKADRYLEGMSDGADVVADAIRHLGFSGEDAK